MKRVGLILFSAIYLLSVVSISFTLHLCGGDVKSVSLSSAEDHVVKCCGMKVMTADCCKDKTVTIKGSEKKHYSSSSSLPSLFAKCISELPDIYLVTVPAPVLNSVLQTHAPPHPPNCPVHILNRVLLV